MVDVDPLALPFKEQIAYFRDKAKVTTEAYTDIFGAEHNTAFMVAGANTAALVNDFHRVIEKLIVKGVTLEDFRRDFDSIVAKTGWAYNGGRNWRTNVIYDTNLRQSYSAGREAQMSDPELRKLRPYGRYVHNMNGISEKPRPEHEAWHNTTLPLDDPWWDTHTPICAYKCKCGKQMLSDDDVSRLGLTVANKAPPIVWRDVTVGSNGPSPRTVSVPEGIDPGFDYRPGSMRTLAALGKTATLPPQLGVDYFAAVKKEALPGIVKDYKGWMQTVLADPVSRKRSATIWGMGQAEMDFLSARGTLPVRTDITIDDSQIIGAKRDRHNKSLNALTDVEFSTLPVLLATRRAATLFDNQTGNILYILNPLGVDDRKIKVVVQPDFFDKRKAGPDARTVFKVGLNALLDSRRYSIIEGILK